MFLTYIVKPWDELNVLLSKPFAFQPGVSDVIRLASDLAVRIRHQAEAASLDEKAVWAESTENKIISDVADAWKHGKLRDSSRDNELFVASQFECNAENKFRFLRNIITVKHTTFGEIDFMAICREAICYWIHKLELPINWNGQIAEGPPRFEDVACLYFNPKYQIKMNTTRIKCVRRNPDGMLEPYDCPEVRLAVHEIAG